MPQYIDPLDRVPQVPADWANHIVYGGALGLALLAGFAGLEVAQPEVYAAECVFVVAAAKKIYDFVREGESVAVCAGKAIVTALWPASIALVVNL